VLQGFHRRLVRRSGVGCRGRALCLILPPSSIVSSFLSFFSFMIFSRLKFFLYFFLSGFIVKFLIYLSRWLE
jgi:hypothetical protein